MHGMIRRLYGNNRNHMQSGHPKWVSAISTLGRNSTSHILSFSCLLKKQRFQSHDPDTHAVGAASHRGAFRVEVARRRSERRSRREDSHLGESRNRRPSLLGTVAIRLASRFRRGRAWGVPSCERRRRSSSVCGPSRVRRAKCVWRPRSQAHERRSVRLARCPHAGVRCRGQSSCVRDFPARPRGSRGTHRRRRPNQARVVGSSSCVAVQECSSDKESRSRSSPRFHRSDTPCRGRRC